MTKQNILDQAISPIKLTYIEHCIDNYENAMQEFDLCDYDLYKDRITQEWVVCRDGYEGEIARI